MTHDSLACRCCQGLTLRGVILPGARAELGETMIPCCGVSLASISLVASTQVKDETRSAAWKRATRGGGASAGKQAGPAQSAAGSVKSRIVLRGTLCDTCSRPVAG